MLRGVVLLLLFLALLPPVSPITLNELIQRYDFSKSSIEFNVTSYNDFMIDKDEDGVNDTFLVTIRADNSRGNFIASINIFDAKNAVVSETSYNLSAGANAINLSIDSIYLAQGQFNYSILVYNSSRILKYRKDKIPSNAYTNYKKGFAVLDFRDYISNGNLEANVTVNSTVAGMFPAKIVLVVNDTRIQKTKYFDLIDGVQNLSFVFDGNEIRKTHFSGSFNITFVSIGKSRFFVNHTTSQYSFEQFGSNSYIRSLRYGYPDLNSNNLADYLEAIFDLEITKDGQYLVYASLYDSLGNLVKSSNQSFWLGEGSGIAKLKFNGTKIYESKSGGPYVIKNIFLYSGGILMDKASPLVISSLNFDDFERPGFPDLALNMTVSDDYKYGRNNITLNFTVVNRGDSSAYNIFFEIFDNGTFFKANMSNVIQSGSIFAYSIEIINASDLEIIGIADSSGSVEESNEENNFQKLGVSINSEPVLRNISDINSMAREDVIVNLSGYDLNGDNLKFSINSSKFANNSNIFYWRTTSFDYGNYTFMAFVSDGYLNDTKIFNVFIEDNPQKDYDLDGINDSIDKILGNEKSISTSTLSLSVLVNGSSNLSVQLNDTVPVEVYDNSSPILEFKFDFGLQALDLMSMSIEKQNANKTGSMLVRKLILPNGALKKVYIEKVNNTNGVCIKDNEIESISEISNDCSGIDEFRVICDGSLQSLYRCSYNLTLNKFKVEGLRNSGVVQYSIQASSPADLPPSSGSGGLGGSSGSGGGSTPDCSPKWECKNWSSCIRGEQRRQCIDENSCAFLANKPEESRKCTELVEQGKEDENLGFIDSFRNFVSKRKNGDGKELNRLTGLSVKNELTGSAIAAVVFALVPIILLSIYIRRKISRKN